MQGYVGKILPWNNGVSLLSRLPDAAKVLSAVPGYGFEIFVESGTVKSQNNDLVFLLVFFWSFALVIFWSCFRNCFIFLAFFITNRFVSFRSTTLVCSHCVLLSVGVYCLKLLGPFHLRVAIYLLNSIFRHVQHLICSWQWRGRQ